MSVSAISFESHIEHICKFTLLSIFGNSLLSNELLFAILQILSTWKRMHQRYGISLKDSSAIGIAKELCYQSSNLAINVKKIPLIYLLLDRFKCFLEVLFIQNFTTPGKNMRRWGFVLLIEFVKLVLCGVFNQELLLKWFTHLQNLFYKLVHTLKHKQNRCFSTRATDESLLHHNVAKSCRLPQINCFKSESISDTLFQIPKVSIQGSVPQRQIDLEMADFRRISLDIALALRPCVLTSFMCLVDLWKGSQLYSRTRVGIENSPQPYDANDMVAVSAGRTLAAVGTQHAWVPWIMAFLYDYSLYRMTKYIDLHKQHKLICLPPLKLKDSSLSVTGEKSRLDEANDYLTESCRIPVFEQAIPYGEDNGASKESQSRQLMFSGILRDPFYTCFYIRNFVDGFLINGGLALLPLVGSRIREVSLHFQRMQSVSWLFNL